MSNQHFQGYANVISQAAYNNLLTAFFVLLAMGGAIMMIQYYRPTQPAEKYVGNVGNEGIYNLQREPSKKQLGCYNDMDCPDETKCTDQGLCVPIIHELPRSKHTLKWGRGRQDEKPT